MLHAVVCDMKNSIQKLMAWLSMTVAGHRELPVMPSPVIEMWGVKGEQVPFRKMTRKCLERDVLFLGDE